MNNVCWHIKRTGLTLYRVSGSYWLRIPTGGRPLTEQQAKAVLRGEYP